MDRIMARLNDGLNAALMTAGGVAVLALMALATGNVLMRLFHMPFRGTYEIVSFLGAVVVASALGYTQRRRDHIVVDILAERFPRNVVRAVTIVADLAVAVFFAVVSFEMASWGLRIMRSGELSETLKMPFHPFVLVVAFCFAVLSLTAAIDFFRRMSRTEGRTS